MGYRGGKSYAAREAAEREKNQRGAIGDTKTQTKNQNSPRRMGEEPMEKQNRVNKEKDMNTQRQETRSGNSKRERRRGSDQEGENTRKGYPKLRPAREKDLK